MFRILRELKNIIRELRECSKEEYADKAKELEEMAERMLDDLPNYARF